MYDDSDLIQRVLDGERSAFDTLVARYYAAVLRQAKRRVRRPEDAEEVTQNVFVKAYLGLPHLQRAADFEHWLRVITARESISWLRGARPDHEPAEAGAEVEDVRLSPEEMLIAGEMRVAVRRAIEALPEHERRVAQAFYFEGNSYREIERRYGLAHSSVAGYLYRARQRLATQLKGVLPSFTCAPGLASLFQNAWRLILEGDHPMHMTRAAVAAASVVTVAMVARNASPPAHHAHPILTHHMGVAPRVERRHPAITAFAIPSVPAHLAATPTAHALAHNVLRTMETAADLALGTGVAAADEDPPVPESEPDTPPPPPPPPPRASPTPGGLDAGPVHVGENEIIFRQDGHTRRFFMQDGKLQVEEDGKTRPATEEETARYQRIQERVKALKERAKELKARAKEIQAQAEESRRTADMKRAEVDAQRSEELRKAADELRRTVETRVREQQRSLEALRAQALEEAARARVEAEKARADAARARDEVGKPGKGPAEGGAERRDLEREMQRLQREMSRLNRSQGEAQRSTARIQDQLKPLLERIGPLAEAAAKAGQPNPAEIEKMVADIMSRLEPILKEAASLGEEAGRLQEELQGLSGGTAPEKPGAERAKPAAPAQPAAPVKPSSPEVPKAPAAPDLPQGEPGR